MTKIPIATVLDEEFQMQYDTTLIISPHDTSKLLRLQEHGFVITDRSKAYWILKHKQNSRAKVHKFEKVKKARIKRMNNIFEVVFGDCCQDLLTGKITRQVDKIDFTTKNESTTEIPFIHSITLDSETQTYVSNGELLQIAFDID